MTRHELPAPVTPNEYIRESTVTRNLGAIPPGEGCRAPCAEHRPIAVRLYDYLVEGLRRLVLPAVLLAREILRSRAQIAARIGIDELVSLDAREILVIAFSIRPRDFGLYAQELAPDDSRVARLCGQS